jgi:hypothetical protein
MRPGRCDAGDDGRLAASRRSRARDRRQASACVMSMPGRIGVAILDVRRRAASRSDARFACTRKVAEPMPDFILLNAPNFVLVHVPPDDERAWGDEPVHLNPAFAQLTRCLGLRVQDCDPADRVLFNKDSKPLLAPVLDRYGFDRPPRTVGELHGLFDYCDRLDMIAGTELGDSPLHAEWRRLASDLNRTCSGLPRAEAVDYYRRRETSALRLFHREQETLSVLGRAYTVPLSR